MPDFRKYKALAKRNRQQGNREHWHQIDVFFEKVSRHDPIAGVRL